MANAYVRIDGVNTVIYQPSASKQRRTALVAMHDNGDNLHHPALARLAEAGYTALAANARTAPDPEDHDTNWHHILTDVGTVVRFARNLQGIDRVVLYGHSSGAPLMAAYQNLAENGLAVGQTASLLSPCPASLADLPTAEGVLLLDPVFGLGANVLASVNPAIVDESNPTRLDPSLDYLRPENGFSGVAVGATYSAEFRGRFFAAQAARNNRLIEAALERVRLLDAGSGRWGDDEPFVIPGCTRYPRLWRPDLGLLSHTRRAHRLLRADGSTAEDIIRSVRRPSGAEPNSHLLAGGALNTTVRRFLSSFATWALPNYAVTEDGIEGVDWASSITNTPSVAPGVHVPMLVMGMTAHYWLVSAELTCEAAGSQDRTLAFVEGATHGFTPLDAGFGDTFGRTVGYIADWLDERF
jgi:hypothetical protein